MSAAMGLDPQLETADDRCATCGGLYGAPDLENDPYDYPCTCPFPPEQVINSSLGERFVQEDGRPGWYSADGLYLLRTTPVRAAFNGPDGEDLYVYANLDTRPAPARELGALREQAKRDQAEIARLQGIVAAQDEQLARLADAPTREALDKLAHERAVDRARLEQVTTILERRDLPPMTRVLGAVAANKAVAYKLKLRFGEEPEASEPTAVNMGEVERIAGAGERSAGKHLGLLAEAGLLTREVRRTSRETEAGEREFRSAVIIGPGTGNAPARLPNPRFERDRAYRERERRERTAREATILVRLAELEAAAAGAAHGCPLCGGDLIATGHVCRSCCREFSTASLAGMPQAGLDRRIVDPEDAEAGLDRRIVDPEDAEAGLDRRIVDPEDAEAGLDRRFVALDLIYMSDDSTKWVQPEGNNTQAGQACEAPTARSTLPNGPPLRRMLPD